MATFKKGVLGGFSGLVGSIVGSNWNGLDVFRSRPKKSTKPKTLAQLDQQSKFTLIMNFLGRIDKVIKAGYQANKGVLKPMNAAFRYHEKNAILGVYPDYTLDYSKVLLSDQRSTKLQTVYNATIEALPLNIIELKWETFIDRIVETHATDTLTVLFYNPEKDAYMAAGEDVIRSTHTLLINFPRLFTGDIVHGWAFFTSADGKLVSRTTYLGQATIEE